MPWTVSDVDSHKKGLTPKQKKQWCRIANSVLAACIKRGGTDKTCAPKAIKQANGVVMNTNASADIYSSYKSKQLLDYEVKITTHQEKAHLILPVVMMVEGVHNGSQGPILHSIAELGKFPASWNGIPVVIYHPEEDGQSISANSPKIIDTMAVGRVYNTVVDENKLKAEIWLDEDKLNTISNITLEMINDSKEMEVSLGMFTENEEEEGEYAGKKYEAIAYNHRPDHLAILPDQVGACSLEDGCGLGTNQKSEDMKNTEMIKNLSLAGYSINEIGNHAEQGYKEKMEAVYSILRALETNDSYCYLEEMYDDSLVYSKSGKEGNKIYKQTYKFESGKVEFVGEPVEVHKKVEYIVNSSNNKKEEKQMANEKDCPKCLEKINALIANKDSKFDEANREWLLTLNETTLDKLEPTVVEKIVEKEIEKTVEVNKLSKEDQDDLAWAKAQRKARRENLIKGIQDNAGKDRWTDEKLAKYDDTMLTDLYESVKKEEPEGDYSLNGGTFNTNRSEHGIEVELPVDVVFAEKNKK